MRRYLPWIVGAILFGAYFAYFETMAFVHPDRYATLSDFVSTVGAQWPLAIFLAGFLCGGLAVHFFWPWRDNPLGKGRG